MKPKIVLQLEAGLKEFQIRDQIENELQYPSGWMKERRAGSMA
jgi:hypothetical protein